MDVDQERLLAARLNTVVVHLGRRLRRMDFELGLPTAQASALALLVSAGRHTVGDLAKYEQVAAPTMTRIVAALEQGGLVKRMRSDSDLRSVYVEATPAGATLIRRAHLKRIAGLEAEIAELSSGEVALLGNAVEILARIAERPSHLAP